MPQKKPAPTKDNVVTSVRLPPELRARLRKHMATLPEGSKKQEVIATALDEYLKARKA